MRMLKVKIWMGERGMEIEGEEQKVVKVMSVIATSPLFSVESGKDAKGEDES